jgi:hypothetical protein
MLNYYTDYEILKVLEILLDSDYTTALLMAYDAEKVLLTFGTGILHLI